MQTHDVAPTIEPYAGGEQTTIGERVVVSPGAGKFFPLPPEIFTTEGEWVEPGTVLAEIRNGASTVPVECSFRGWMMGMLVIPGQPVRAGAPLFWIRSA